MSSEGEINSVKFYKTTQNLEKEVSTITVDKVDKNASSSSNGDPLYLRPRQLPPNIPEMLRCLNCDTNFHTKYQLQQHQCEINAEKINFFLKPNVDGGVGMKFECSTCGKVYVNKSSLEIHLTSHDEYIANICEHCNKRFVSENRLRIHKEGHCKKAGEDSKIYRSKIKVFKCIKCYQVFSSDVFAYNHAENCSEIYDLNEISNIPIEDLIEMEENEGALINGSRFIQVVVTETLLQCEFCNKTFADKKSLITHQDTHTTAVNYNCVFCEETFDSYVVAAKHWLTKCTHDANLFFLPKLTYCKECDGTFKSHEWLYTHKIKKNHYTAKKYKTIKTINQNGPQIPNIIEGAIGANFNKPPNQVELQEMEVIDYKVEETLENVSVSENDDVLKTDDFEGDSLNGKKKRDRKEKNVLSIDSGLRYQCERCLLVFKNIQSLEGHHDKDHPVNYKCEECNQVVRTSKAVETHMRAHRQLKPYVCEICNKCFTQSSHLWQHTRCHQGIRPFACAYQGCEARFTRNAHRNEHIQRVHTHERKYACNVCDKRFFRAGDLKTHCKIHTGER